MTKTRKRSRFLAFLKWTGISVAALAGMALVLNLTTGMHLQITGGLMPQLDFHDEGRHYRAIERHREQSADVAPAVSPAPRETVVEEIVPRRRSRSRAGRRDVVRLLALLPRRPHGRPLSGTDQHSLAERRPAGALAYPGRRRLRVLRRRRWPRLHDRAAAGTGGRRRLRPADRRGTLERELGRPFPGEHGRRRTPRHPGPVRRHPGRARRHRRTAGARRRDRRFDLAHEHPRRLGRREPDLGHGGVTGGSGRSGPHRARRPERRRDRLRTRHRRDSLAGTRRPGRLHRAGGLHAGRPFPDRPDRRRSGHGNRHRRQRDLLEPALGDDERHQRRATAPGGAESHLRVVRLRLRRVGCSKSTPTSKRTRRR